MDLSYDGKYPSVELLTMLNNTTVHLRVILADCFCFASGWYYLGI